VYTRQILESYCSKHLEEVVSCFECADELDPLKADIYIGISLLQKSIRRGQSENAIPAALCVLRHSQSAFWRRICIISFEDIGVANIELVGAVLIAAGRKKLRHDLGGDETVAKALVVAMCGSDKDRSLDDVFEFAQNSKGLDPLKRHLGAMPPRERLEVATINGQPLAVQALATLSYSIGLPISRQVRQGRVNRTNAFLDSLVHSGFDPLLIELARYGLARSRTILPILLPVVFNLRRCPETKVQSDIFAPIVLINELPCWVYNANTRIGLAAIRAYIKQSKQMSEFLCIFSTKEISKNKIVGNLIFRQESTLLKDRLIWDVGKQIRNSVDTLCPGVRSGSLVFGNQILSEEFGQLNQCRFDAAQLYLR